MYDQQKKLLIVEDDAIMRNIIVETLSGAYSILTASDGEDAWQKIHIHKPEVILLDIMLPKYNGLEILSKLRTDPDPKIASTGVIVLSNLSGESDIKKAQKFGIAAYFPKAATDLQVVMEKVHELMQAVSG